MFNKSVTAVVILVTLFSFTGCSSYELTKYADKPSCVTTIEGNYYKKDSMDKYNLVLRLRQPRRSKPVELNLAPNEPFSYCIEPGEYRLEHINFVDENNKIEHVGYDLPRITITIDSGKINYLGDIFADYRTKTDENVLIIPCNNNDQNAAGAAGMFGLIGSLAYGIANEIANSDLHHVIHLEYNKNFVPESKGDIQVIKLNIQKAD